MRSMIRSTPIPQLLAAVVMTALLVLAQGHATQADSNPFDTLLGSWRGSGQIELDGGRMERLKCNAYYTGGGAQLGMAIRCQSETSNVEIRSKLSQSGGRITGTWEERTYNAEGSATGQATSDKMSLQISGGGVTGTMSVSCSGSRQSVAIATQGIALKSVTIDLTRS
jgi:hypothetical protein